MCTGLMRRLRCDQKKTLAVAGKCVLLTIPLNVSIVSHHVPDSIQTLYVFRVSSKLLLLVNFRKEMVSFS